MSVLIIAEAGVNHNGSLARAKKMALAAKTAGADIVKYQTAVPELVVSKFAEKAEYQKAQTGAGESQLEMVRRIHFGFDGHRELKAYCEEIGIEYLSTPFDLDSIDFLASLELPVYKIPSGEITNLPYLERIAALKKPVILSTGMSTLAEIEDAMSVLEDGGVEDITLLHCRISHAIRGREPARHAGPGVPFRLRGGVFRPHAGLGGRHRGRGAWRVRH